MKSFVSEMADDFDQTQALFLDEFEQDTDEDDQKDKRPVSSSKTYPSVFLAS